LPTYSLQRFDERKLEEALAALRTAEKTAEAAPLHPWLELWRAESCAEGEATADDFRALFLSCTVGKPVDLLDRTPARMAGGAADKDLRSALLGFELGYGLDPWARDHGDLEPSSILSSDTILGIFRSGDVERWNPRLQAITAFSISVDEDELETYMQAWERFLKAFATACERKDGLALVARS
jgi:hypothetical protein